MKIKLYPYLTEGIDIIVWMNDEINTNNYVYFATFTYIN